MNALNIIIPAASVSPRIAATKTMADSLVLVVVKGPLDDVVRPALHLVIHAAEILSQHADPDELHSAKHDQQRDERGVTGGRRLDPDNPAHRVENSGGEPRE